MFRANTYKPLDKGMAIPLAILQLCRWKFSHKETLYQTLVVVVVVVVVVVTSILKMSERMPKDLNVQILPNTMQVVN